MKKDPRIKSRTRWQRWNEIGRAAIILGVVPDSSMSSMFKVNQMLEKRIQAGLVDKKKPGHHQSSPAFYRAVM